jgi:hypothetical protein
MELQTPRATAKGPASTFTGDVYVTPIYAGTGTSRMTVALVRFVPGARSNWHRHAVGQTLHVTEGDTFMSHLAMLENLPDGGDPTTWLEPVPDEDYELANQQ